MIKKISIIVSLSILAIGTFAQQDAMYTHYMFNTQGVNPAYAGTRDAFTVTALHRSQWVGFDGAPVTQSLTMHTPLLNDKLGLGLSVVNDVVGPIKSTSFNVDFSYKIKIGDSGGKLSFGLKGGGNLMSGTLSSLSTETAGDNSFTNNIQSQFLPNFGFGMYYYETKWYVGLSTPRLLENDFKSNVVTGSTNPGSEKRHYFLIAGAAFEINESLTFKPTTLVKVTTGAPVEIDLTAQFVIKEKFWVAPMWRSGDALGVLVGYQFTDQLSAGYSFDWSYTNKTFAYNGGSHEVMLRYDLLFNEQKKIRSPRYF
jgi:type IX secretion system PorP/SprF family membrane protein